MGEVESEKIHVQHVHVEGREEYHIMTRLHHSILQPATVSRCGMIYLEPATFGWQPVFTSWIMQLPPVLADHTPLIKALVEWLAVPCLDLVQRHLKGRKIITSSLGHCNNLHHYAMEFPSDHYFTVQHCIYMYLSVDYLIMTSCSSSELVVTSESNLTRSLMHMFDMMMSSAVEDEKTTRDNKNLRVWIVVCCVNYEPVQGDFIFKISRVKMWQRSKTSSWFENSHDRCPSLLPPSLLPSFPLPLSSLPHSLPLPPSLPPEHLPLLPGVVIGCYM